LGVCSPFAAQAKLLKRLIVDLRLSHPVDAGTVHRYQGNEKEMMVIDIPDGLGEPRPGRWLDAELPDDDGAKLFNVAISRSQHHLVFIANIDYLDKKLPAQSLNHFFGVCCPMRRRSAGRLMFVMYLLITQSSMT
jgi:superfamily I DNA and/or RNA helicase